MGDIGSPNRVTVLVCFATVLAATAVPVALAGSGGPDAGSAASTAKLAKQVKKLKKKVKASDQRSKAAVSATRKIQAGETVRGVYVLGVEYELNGTIIGSGESLPRAAPVALSPSTVHVDGEDEIGNVCTGSREQPTAPPGHLCVYPGNLGLIGATNVEGTGNSPWGFSVNWETTGAGVAFDTTAVEASWAYTAP